MLGPRWGSHVLKADKAIQRAEYRSGVHAFLDGVITRMERFHILEKRRHSWGDYFDILMHGMSRHLGRGGSRIQLERTGPFVPPISLPGINDVVLTDAFRKKLERSGLEGLRFQPVIKKLIVQSDWHTWDKQAEEPSEYPDGGEPASYILEQPHSAPTAKHTGSLPTRISKSPGRISGQPWGS